VCSEGLARFCTTKYQAPKKANFKDVYMHLTNYAVNCMGKNFVKSETDFDIMTDNSASKRTFASLYDSLSKQGINIEIIKQSIESTCSKIMQILGPMLEHQTKISTSKAQLKGQPFQLLGIDLLID